MHKLNRVLVLHLINQNPMKNLKIEFDHEDLDVCCVNWNTLYVSLT